jgi:hypothetical protein
MELKRRIDQIIKTGEAAISWTETEGFVLSFKHVDDNFPEEILILLAFIDRYCHDDSFADEMLQYFDEKCSIGEN